MSQALIAQILGQRDSWCVLRAAADGKPALRVKLRRPPETELHRFAKSGAEPYHDRVRTAVVEAAQDWDGFTEEDLLGESIGGSDLVPWSQGLWAVVIADRAEWLGKCTAHLFDAIQQHMERQGQLAKN